MQLPDESIEYSYQRLIAPPPNEWSPLAELQSQHLLSADRIEAIRSVMNTVRGQVAAERELTNPPAKLQPLMPGFIDLPQKLLDQFRRKGDDSTLGRVSQLSTRMRDNCDRVVVLGVGGSSLGAKALFQALGHTYHNELPDKLRMGKPRLYFEGDNLDNDSLAELLELLENTCEVPDDRAERWGIIVCNRSGESLETAAAYRAVRAELARYYAAKSDQHFLKELVIGITGASTKLRDLMLAEGYSDDEILTTPDDVNSRYAVFTPAGLLPAAIVGLDVRALLLGAAAMTKRFLEEPFDRNPVLQFAAVNHLMTEELGKRTRVMTVWGRKLEAIGHWYDHIVGESLGKLGKGPTPMTVVASRDLYSRGQLLQEGNRDKIVNNLYVRTVKHNPIMIGMADRNEDDLNSISRKGFPDLMEAAFHGTNKALEQAARPSADISLPVLSEHTLGQLLQMMMLATVVEGRLANVNPYGQSAADPFQRHTFAELRATPNLPKGEVRDAAKGV
ncbi:MAG: hypothetical protein LC104_21880 [Bacteroidales bacterium]|nr:hypothetical protein [Bacteroidales bacterium]